MSCGNHHEMPCSDVLEVIYLYLDHEEMSVEREIVSTHLVECAPCQGHFEAENMLKTLIARALFAQQAPREVHTHIIASITEIHLEITTVHEHP